MPWMQDHSYFINHVTCTCVMSDTVKMLRIYSTQGSNQDILGKIFVYLSYIICTNTHSPKFSNWSCLFIPVTVIILDCTQKTRFFHLFNILIALFPLCRQCALNSLAPSISQPQSFLSSTGTVSARLHSQMNLGVYETQCFIWGKKWLRLGQISYPTVDLVAFGSSHYPLSERGNDDGWVLSYRVQRDWTIAAHIPVSPAAMARDLATVGEFEWKICTVIIYYEAGRMYCTGK